jgi:hypothetical protein
MSFGIKSFKKSKQDQISQDRKHISHVILGQDLSSVLKLVELKKTHGPESLRLITPRFLTREILEQHYISQISTLRDNVQTLEVTGLYPNAQSVRFEEEPLFYKDGGWHKFNSRAKPMELQGGESFYQAPRQEIKLSSLFSDSDWNELDETLKAYQSVRILEKLEKINPTDLAHQDEWWMLFHDLGEVTCTHLYSSLAAREVLKRSGQGQTLPTEMAAWLSSIKKISGIGIYFECNDAVYPDATTLFVPQSMTHEWGHFVVDVHEYDQSKKIYPLTALILLHDEEPTSELMADKIKLMKRVFERVFNGFEKRIETEFIYVNEDYLEWSDEAKLAEDLIVSVPTLTLLGPLAAHSIEKRFLSKTLSR